MVGTLEKISRCIILFILEILFIMACRPALALQQNPHPDDTVPISRKTENSMLGGISDRTVIGIDSPDGMMTIENGNTKNVLSKDSSRQQLVAISRNLDDFLIGTDDAAHKISKPLTGSPSQKKITDKTENATGPESPPNIFWFFVLGIIGILSVRRTIDRTDIR